ncbi:acyl-CoA thioesterase [Cellvibrio japonicus]|uniref:Thioesterase family protein domain protein n=1 Tax=Cellvibrio japonicus (strain Ueda107) TaxID=498211 RepID=B3PG34_CELJU|nr:thioesterase family protein [Cellvibrio japonicus]ACE83093.1 thioesterase family protein domain protein [Cellvibrio japonicus Ueda107]QEI13714.1 acyl-CoA thioesterase [Cellvibrio japonicus]QEI17288.1 acyl-CoA thioesterase [Cellvibrio japonicus]QEI20865.1 acyl-CoA thioesterase [Cellvibrio japonicus]
MADNTNSAPVFSCAMPVRWGDMDAYGHVNNTLYFRYFEEARFQWMLKEGMPLKSDTHPVVVTIGCTFLRPLFYPEDLRIDLHIAEPGRSSFMIYYKVYTAAQPGAAAAEGYSKVVWVSSENGKSVPLPDAVRRWFDQ